AECPWVLSLIARGDPTPARPRSGAPGVALLARTNIVSPMSREWVDLRIATYNIHRSRGLDRRTRPSRIAAVLANLEPDIAALQEVVGPGLESPGHIEEIG